MKTNILLLFINVFFLFSCNNSDEDTINNNDVDNGSIAEITFLNSNLNTTALVTYTDGATQIAKFKEGKLQLRVSENKDLTIRSITPEGKESILIGRNETDKITEKLEI